MGVLICREKLNEYSESDANKKLFEESKKKDDLADCYLQAIVYCIFEKIIQSNNQNGPIVNVVPKVPKVTNVFIKNKIVEYLKDCTEGTDNKLTLMNGLFENLNMKEQITNKFNIVFPLDEESLKLLFSKLKIKKSII